MKLFVFILAAVSATAFATESVVLDSSVVRLNSNAVVLEKIDLTPSVVDLLVPIPTTVERCEAGHQRTVRGASAVHCGSDVVDLPCYGGQYGHGGYGGYKTTPRGEPHGGGGVVRVPAPAPVCFPDIRRVPRVCSYTVCDRPYTETVTVTRNFKVTFDDYSRDENFNFSLDRHGNVSLSPLLTSPGCTSLVIYGEKPRVDGAKISIKRGWFNRGC